MQVVGNEAVASLTGTTDAWIRERTGITERRIAGPGESVVEMAAAAGRAALEAARCAPASVDLVLLASCSMPSLLPPGAPQVAHLLGVPRTAGTLDVNAACAGFCSALALAGDTVRAGGAEHVLVVGSERMSDWVDPTDRSTAILFGDGAGAVLVGPTDTPAIGPVTWANDGSRASLIEVRSGEHHMRMDGPAVYRWATTELADLARRACELAGVDPQDLDALVVHQANLRIVDALARALGAERAVVSRDVVTTGNTSAASIPLALSALAEDGDLPAGGYALFLSFGAGLAVAGQVVRLP